MQCYERDWNKAHYRLATTLLMEASGVFCFIKYWNVCPICGLLHLNEQAKHGVCFFPLDWLGFLEERFQGAILGWAVFFWGVVDGG